MPRWEQVLSESAPRFLHGFPVVSRHISLSHNFHFATIMNPFSGQGSLSHRFYFPAAWSSPTASISRHQEPQSRLPPKVMVIQGRYYLVRTTQNRTHFLQLYTGIYALWLKRPVFISLGTAKKRNRMTINSITYISEVMFDYTEKRKKNKNKQTIIL